MDVEESSDNPLLCPQCGAELRLEKPQLFPVCSHCGSTLWIDKTRVVFHWMVDCNLDEAQARVALARWMSGNKTATALARGSTIRNVSFVYFPLWHVRGGGEADESLVVEPAAATSVTELKKLRLTAGGMRKYEEGLNLPLQPPTVPLDAVLRKLGQGDKAEGSAREVSLVHVPVYTFKYEFRRRSYTAIVEASAGSVFANIFPARHTGVLDAVAAVTAVTYVGFVASYLPGGAALSVSEVLARAPVFLAVGVLLFFLAAWVARGQE